MDTDAIKDHPFGISFTSNVIRKPYIYVYIYRCIYTYTSIYIGYIYTNIYLYNLRVLEAPTRPRHSFTMVVRDQKTVETPVPGRRSESKQSKPKPPL